MAWSLSRGDPMAGKRCSCNDCLHANVWFWRRSAVCQEQVENLSCLIAPVDAFHISPFRGRIFFSRFAIPVTKEPEPERAPH